MALDAVGTVWEERIAELLAQRGAQVRQRAAHAAMHERLLRRHACLATAAPLPVSGRNSCNGQNDDSNSSQLQQLRDGVDRVRTEQRRHNSSLQVSRSASLEQQ